MDESRNGLEGNGRYRFLCFGAATVALVASCVPWAAPPPQAAVQQFNAALEQNDPGAVRDTLDADSRQELSEQEVKQLVALASRELRQRGKAFAAGDAVVEVSARLALDDHTTAHLVLERGGFRIRSVSSFPSGAETPQQAIADLRGALVSRSYSGLLRVLSEKSRADLEEHVDSLVIALENPDVLKIETQSDRAVVVTPDGHRVELTLENGLWKIHDFE